jgi:hypothetical protein
MRFLLTTPPDKNAQAGAPPDPKLMAAIGKLGEEMTKAGVLLETGGLSSKSVRVGLSGGKLSVTDGPFTETKEVIGGYAILEAASMKEASELTRRFLAIHGDEWNLECEVRPLDGPEVGARATGRRAASRSWSPWSCPQVVLAADQDRGVNRPGLGRVHISRNAIRTRPHLRFFARRYPGSLFLEMWTRLPAHPLLIDFLVLELRARAVELNPGRIVQN